MKRYLILARANIKSRKESFIGITVLTMLIIMTLTAVYSMRGNVGDWIERANISASTGDLMVWIDSNDLGDDMLEQLGKSYEIRSFDKIETALVAGESKIYVNGKAATDSIYLMDYIQPNHKYKVFSKNCLNYVSDNAGPGEGEIYLPVSYKRLYSCAVGDEVLLEASNMKMSFTIKGFVEEPACGAAVIGTKFFFLNSGDLNSVLMKADTEYDSVKNADSVLRWSMVHIFRQDDSKLNMGEFKEKINAETGILDSASLSMTVAQSKEYTAVIFTIVSIALYVFMAIMFIVVLIMINHSIKAGIELEINDIGGLKSIGFNNKQLRIVYLLVYLMAEIIGTVLGFLLARPLMLLLNRLFIPIIGGILTNSINFLVGIVLFATVTSSSSLLIVMKVRQFGKIRTVSTITGRLTDRPCNTQRLNKINGDKLDLGMAVRPLRTDSRQYRGLLFISALLVFFMMLANQIASISENDIMEKFIGYRMDIQVTYTDGQAEKESVDSYITETVGVASLYRIATGYFQVGNGRYICTGISDTSQITGLISGRLPQSNKEVIATQGVLDELGKKVNDTVSITNNDNEETYIIVGVYQTMVDMGLALCMTYDGMRLISPKETGGCTYAYVLDNHENRVELINSLQKEFDGKINVESPKSSDVVGIFSFASKLITAVIYFFTALFALIISYMISKKICQKERKDIGVLKSIGFSSGTLRKQFVLRFAIITLIGGLIGFLLNLALSNLLLGAIFSFIGITSYHAGMNPLGLVLPLLLNTAVFMLFSYVASQSIRRVQIKYLIME